MMVAFLLMLHLPLLLGVYRVLEREVGRIIALVFLVYTGAFTVLKPALLYYLGLYFPYSTNAQAAVVSLLIGSLLFLCIEYATIRWFCRNCPRTSVIRWFDLSHAKPHGVWLMFIVLMGVSFIGSAVKFADFGFLWSTVSSFDADMAQANGSYYLNYVSGSLYYGAILVIGYYATRLKPLKWLVLILVVLALTYLWTRMAARTGILVVLVAWLAGSMSHDRQRQVHVFYIACFGYLLLGLLYVGNLIRLGSVAEVDVSTALFGSAIAAMSDMGPVDNAVLLYDEMHNHESTDFVQLAGALTPLILIPSSVFPIKPPADKDATLTRMFFPDGADPAFFHEGSTLTFTVPASGYADAGFIGAAVSSLIYAAIFCVYLWIFKRGTVIAKFVAATLIIIHIVGYRLSVEALLLSFYAILAIMGTASALITLLSGLKAFGGRGVASHSSA